MLALYHLFSGVSAKDLADVEMLLQTTGVPQAPKACRAVLVGTALSPGIPHTKPDGTIIHTLWGELAWQLGGQKGYALVANNDANGSSPGSVILSELFKMCSPCLILIDEWVAYARQTYGKIDLPGGSFDSNMTFAQAITEATRATPGTMLVASIPASQIEIGGEGGREALARIQNTFSRMESPWRPASAEESYEIVRRRLFEPIADPELFATRDAVIRAFGQAYRQAGSDFPQGVDEADYQRRMTNAYPIHPELFDRLYEDWSSLERFQRTRGVLRLMASVISELWERQDSSLLILPASIPMDAPVVQSELTRYLEDNWRPIMEQDVDGPEAVPLRIDRDVPTLGRYSATRRVARTIFLGSAPTVKSKNPGIDDRRVKLGCFQPGENVATFGDALRRLTGSKARHLYVDGSRYWFSTQPSVTGLADDRAAQISIDDVWEELKTRLRSDRQRGEFAAVHVTPASSGDVPDEMEARMVILGPTQRHTSKAKDSQALNSASEILNARGSSPRFYKNMLVFLAPDQARLNDLEEAIRQYLAWNSIWEHRETLNLDAFQSSLARTRREQATKTVDSRILETYFWLLYPGQPDPQGPVEWQESRLQGLEPLAVRASRKLVNDGNLMNQFSAINLRLELDRCNLWKDVDHLSVKKLWEYFASYIYLPRLTGSGVLTKAIQEGVALVTWSEAFVYAERWDESACRYLGLKIGQHTSVILDGQSVIVKPSAAKAQLEAEKKPSVQPPGTAQPGGTGGTQPGPSPIPIPGGGGVTITIEPTKSIAPRRFYASVKLDPMRISGNAGKIAEEVVQHLSSLLGANVDVTLEIQVKVPEGVPENIVRTVTENCRTLKFSQYGFEEE
ncbi:MAG TPA: DUF499 domain-containing protein [Syntrophobacteraceae bacterium]|nr:DUF499 domain-containing protein [Syntrophobacteraceae bacterium]